jgi:hypothetical protein
MAGGTGLSVLTSIATPGDYTVDWRSVSNDGHPNEGTFKFTVANTSGYEQETVDALACPMLMSGEPSPIAYTMDDMKRDATGEESDNSPLVGLGIGAGFIVLGGIATAITAKVRERRGAKKKAEPKKNDDEDNDNFITIVS